MFVYIPYLYPSVSLIHCLAGFAPFSCLMSGPDRVLQLSQLSQLGYNSY